MPQLSLAQLTRLIAHAESGAALLGRLHELLLEAAGGVASLTVHLDPPSGTLRASSGSRVAYLPLDPWPGSPAETEAIASATAQGTLMFLEFEPGSRTADLLHAGIGLAVPLVGQDGPYGAVLVGLGEPAAPDRIETDVLAVADAFVLALERARFRRAADLQRDLAGLAAVFRDEAMSWAALNPALARACRTAARIFAAVRAAAWLHDRSARELVLAASSEGGHGPRSARVPVADALSGAASALRYETPELTAGGPDMSGANLLIPLKGRRRAVGVLECERVHVEPGNERQLLDAASVLGGDLALAIENVMLVEEAVRGHREVESLLDAIDDMAVVCDAELRIVRANDAFATRASVPKSDLAGRELRDLAGDALAEWVREVVTGPSLGPMRRREIEGPLAPHADVQARPIRGDAQHAAGAVVIVRPMPAWPRSD